MKELVKEVFSRVIHRLHDRYNNGSYSQDGEDRILANLFYNQNAGFFVDVGAHHPKRFSNTFLLYRRGWRGINIDPVPGVKRTFERERPRDITLECGISDVPGELEFYLYDEPAYNTFNAEMKDYFQKRGFPKFLEVRKVPVYRLRDVLDRHLPPGQAIDFLTIDTEGWDLKVLESNDWTRYRPHAVIAEDGGKDIESSLANPIGVFLREQGYRLSSRTTQSVIWVDKSKT